MCDEKGIEWAYEPDSWLSALGKELGWEHEQTELEYAMSALRPGGAYVDVGAHVGGYAIPITQKVEGVAIHLFEPVASTRELLQRNLARNGVLERVRIWPYAVGDVADRVQIADETVERSDCRSECRRGLEPLPWTSSGSMTFCSTKWTGSTCLSATSKVANCRRCGS